MTEKKLSEIRKWWKSIEKLGVHNQTVDVILFADMAFDYIPVLLAEIARLQGERK